MDHRPEDKDSVNMKTLCLQDTKSCADIFKVASDPDGSRDRGWSRVLARPRGDARFPFCCDWSLGDGRTRILENTSVGLEQLNAPLQ